MQSYWEAVEYIDHIGKYGQHPGIENATKLLAALNHPEQGLKIIHVAGTNGKGSVCAFLADMLTAQGYRTGLFISPHLVDLRERIQIDREMIGMENFYNYFLTVKKVVEQLGQQGYSGITYFDYLLMIALCWYKDRAVDYVVVETGLGGRLDSTNALKNPMLCIITSISLDHTELLGDTISKIAAEKAGIIKQGVPLIYCADEPDVRSVIAQTAKEMGAPCIGIGRNHCKRLMMEDADNIKNPARLRFSFCLPQKDCLPLTHPGSPFTDTFRDGIHEILTVNSPASYQAENAAIAYTAALWIALLSPRPNKETEQTKTEDMGLRATLKDALANSVWEGRFEQILPNCYLDGAHNADGIRMLLASLSPIAAGKKVTLLFTAVKEKDTDEMIRELCESGLFCRYLVTTVEGARAIAPEQLKETFLRYTDAPVISYMTPKEAFLRGLQDVKVDIESPATDRTVNTMDSILLCAGSLYLVGIIKEFLLKKN